ncbi:hypothetical protein ACLMJK_005162 [Lecanora helva]
MSDRTQTVSIPSLVLLAAFTALTIRYFFFNKPASSASPTDQRSANPADVDQIASMFPQLNRREIMWDLQRNGGSVAATTERVLSRGGLEQPPPTFQPPMPAPSTPSTASSASVQPKQDHIDLIKRYNLAGRMSSPSPTPLQGAEVKTTWSNNKNERQALLQKRREDMILNARRKLKEKDKGKKVERG